MVDDVGMDRAQRVKRRINANLGYGQKGAVLGRSDELGYYVVILYTRPPYGWESLPPLSVAEGSGIVQIRVEQL